MHFCCSTPELISFCETTARLYASFSPSQRDYGTFCDCSEENNSSSGRQTTFRSLVFPGSIILILQNFSCSKVHRFFFYSLNVLSRFLGSCEKGRQMKVNSDSSVSKILPTNYINYQGHLSVSRRIRFQCKL